jgi:hypothetical protein
LWCLRAVSCLKTDIRSLDINSAVLRPKTCIAHRFSIACESRIEGILTVPNLLFSYLFPAKHTRRAKLPWKRKKGKEAAKKLVCDTSPQIGSLTRAKRYPIFVGSIPIPSSITLWFSVLFFRNSSVAESFCYNVVNRRFYLHKRFIKGFAGALGSQYRRKDRKIRDDHTPS